MTSCDESNAVRSRLGLIIQRRSRANWVRLGTPRFITGGNEAAILVPTIEDRGICRALSAQMLMRTVDTNKVCTAAGPISFLPPSPSPRDIRTEEVHAGACRVKAALGIGSIPIGGAIGILRLHSVP